MSVHAPRILVYDSDQPGLHDPDGPRGAHLLCPWCRSPSLIQKKMDTEDEGVLIVDFECQDCNTESQLTLCSDGSGIVSIWMTI